MNVLVSPTPQAAATLAAHHLARAAASAIAERGSFSVALSGGSTPQLMYEALKGLEVDWAHVHVYFSDERSVGPDSDESNYRSAKLGLLGHVGVPAGQVHRMEGERDPARAAADYAALLPERLDLVLLGMGDDGHTASLFPDTEGLQAGGRVIANWVPKLETWRLSFTYAEINAARERWLLVTGANKATVLREVQNGIDGVAGHPVAGVHDATWYLDAAAAAELSL
ncbi:6-phosphogluconolactonase [Deinococcus radiomollis]|uniref:6-phosphogluconolactonase n=1 Tax=Deinococcus radiomollis TaxID=468916 RepID=UPI003891B7BF